MGIGNVCLVPRRWVWELHGGEQNGTVERFSSHRPTDVDGLVAQVRAVSHRFAKRAISCWPSDFSKVYKHVPGDPAQLRFVVLAQWCPYRCRPPCGLRYRKYSEAIAPL